MELGCAFIPSANLCLAIGILRLLTSEVLISEGLTPPCCYLFSLLFLVVLFLFRLPELRKHF